MRSADTMRAVEAQDFSIDALKVESRPMPRPRLGEVLLRVRAASLNTNRLGLTG